MSESEFRLQCLRDPRLAAHATTAQPAWLWTADGRTVRWANAAGAAVLGARDPTGLNGRSFDEADPIRRQLVRLAETLPNGGRARLERLRGLGAGIGRPLTCLCARVALADGTAGLLVAASERAGPELSLIERVQRLFAGVVEPVAVFSPEGALLHATAAAQPRLSGATTLDELQVPGPGTQALQSGHASGWVNGIAVSLDRIGNEPLLMLRFADSPAGAGNGSQIAPPVAAGAELPVPEPAALDRVGIAPPGPAETLRSEAPAGEVPGPTAGGGCGLDETAAAEFLQAADEERAAAPPAPDEPPRWPAPAASPESLPLDRRHPLRFVWEIDSLRRFTLGSAEFARLLGPRTVALLGSPWEQIAAALGLDPAGHIAQAVASCDTWSGVTLAWPVDGTEERIEIELSGLPVFDRERIFRGYRGFGVCRDVERLTSLAQGRATPPPVFDGAGDAMPSPAAPDAQAESAPQSPPAGPPAPAGDGRPVLTIVPQARNVVPFRSPGGEARTPSLSAVERSAFHEIARELSARLGAPAPDGNAAPAGDDVADPLLDAAAPQGVSRGEEGAETATREGPRAGAQPPPATADDLAAPPPPIVPSSADAVRAILDLVPAGVLIYRLDQLLYANRAFLAWTGYDSLDGLSAAGGLDSLFVERSSAPEIGGSGRAFAISTGRGSRTPVEARLFTTPWDGEAALMLAIAAPANDLGETEAALHAARGRIGELETTLDTAADGVLLLDQEGTILRSNAGVPALFGYGADDLTGRRFADLLAPECRTGALAYLNAMASEGRDPIPNDGREMLGSAPDGRQIPLLVTIGPIDDAKQKLCAVVRDLSRWKKVEEDLVAARRQAELASSAKSDFLAKISHEIRTPLNAIIGFAEVMAEERFGPIGNDRYRDYLRDIRTSGGHLISLVNDLLDLSKIEAGKLELSFADFNLNELTQQCVGIMQSQASRERIIMRSSLSAKLPPIRADERSVRQIVLNLLSNSIKFTHAGGQVIVSTALADTGEVVLRVRDTGIGMSAKDIETALEPFRQVATSARASGTGLGLPLSKALAEANRASFHISSAPNSGTLVEVAFAPTQAAAE